MNNKTNLLITTNINKQPYEKILTNHKIINLTGESGSGKSYFAKQYFSNNEYIIIDTDEVFSRYDKSTGINRELGTFFRNKCGELPSLCENFDEIYLEMINYFKGSNKTLVIDSAQFRNVKDISILKGKVIIIRTCINTCFERVIQRFKNQKPNATLEEIELYKNKKMKMYIWYKSLNDFLLKIDKL